MYAVTCLMPEIRLAPIKTAAVDKFVASFLIFERNKE